MWREVRATAIVEATAGQGCRLTPPSDVTEQLRTAAQALGEPGARQVPVRWGD